MQVEHDTSTNTEARRRMCIFAGKLADVTDARIILGGV